MTKETNQLKKEKNSDFGLPQTEFKPIVEVRSKWLKITAIIGSIVLGIGAGVGYWFFYHVPIESTHSTYKEHESEEYESGTAYDNNTTVQHALQDVQTHEQEKKLETLEEGEKTKAFSAYATTQQKQGTITKVETPQGYYYLVVGSFIDDDLALDYAHRLAQQDTADVILIAPAPGKYFYRVAVDQANTLYDANEKIEELKATYGQDVWVMKY